MFFLSSNLVLALKVKAASKYAAGDIFHFYSFLKTAIKAYQLLFSPNIMKDDTRFVSCAVLIRPHGDRTKLFAVKGCANKIVPFSQLLKQPYDQVYYLLAFFSKLIIENWYLLDTHQIGGNRKRSLQSTNADQK